MAERVNIHEAKTHQWTGRDPSSRGSYFR